jgi:hypothetical protein
MAHYSFISKGRFGYTITDGGIDELAHLPTTGRDTLPLAPIDPPLYSCQTLIT